MARRLLIIEDDEHLPEEDAGYHVTSASPSQGALEWASRGGPLDLVVTDVRMAGLDGIAAFAKLKEGRPDVRGIVNCAVEPLLDGCPPRPLASELNVRWQEVPGRGDPN